jgi:hypothetical protein
MEIFPPVVPITREIYERAADYAEQHVEMYGAVTGDFADTAEFSFKERGQHIEMPNLVDEDGEPISGDVIKSLVRDIIQFRRQHEGAPNIEELVREKYKDNDIYDALCDGPVMHTTAIGGIQQYLCPKAQSQKTVPRFSNDREDVFHSSFECWNVSLLKTYAQVFTGGCINVSTLKPEGNWTFDLLDLTRCLMFQSKKKSFARGGFTLNNDLNDHNTAFLIYIKFNGMYQVSVAFADTTNDTDPFYADLVAKAEAAIAYIIASHGFSVSINSLEINQTKIAIPQDEIVLLQSELDGLCVLWSIYIVYIWTIGGSLALADFLQTMERLSESERPNYLLSKINAMIDRAESHFS